MTRTGVHGLFDLAVVALCGTIAGADRWAYTERFGRDRLDRLRTFLPWDGGTTHPAARSRCRIRRKTGSKWE